MISTEFAVYSVIMLQWFQRHLFDHSFHQLMITDHIKTDLKDITCLVIVVSEFARVRDIAEVKN